MQNLFRRPSGVYVARLVVPVRLRLLVGRRELIATTGSRELPLAKIVASALLAQWRRRLFELDRLASANTTMNHESIIRIADGHPTLAAPGYLPLNQAASASGIESTSLLRMASDGRLKLFARLSGVEGYLVPIEDLDRDDTELGSVAIPHARQMPPTAVRHFAPAVLPLPADAVPATVGDFLSGEERVAIAAFATERPGVLFVPDRLVELQMSRLEVSAVEVDGVRRSMASTILPEQLAAARSAQMAATHPSLRELANTPKNGSARPLQHMPATSSRMASRTLTKWREW